MLEGLKLRCSHHNLRMDSEDSCDKFVEALPSDRSSVGLLTNGTMSMSPRPMKAEQMYQACGDFQHENLVSCSSAPPNLGPMTATAVFNQAGQLQPGLMAVQDPNNPEQMVVVQNMNGHAMEEQKAMLNAGLNAGSLQNSLQMAKFNNNGQLQTINPAMLQQISSNGQMLAPSQLAGMMNLAGIPQVTTLNGLNIMNQMGGQTQIIQQQQQQPQQQQTQNVAAPQQIVTQNQQIQQGGVPQGMVAVNGHPNALQQQGQMGNQPQFILAGGKHSRKQGPAAIPNLMWM
ncbi:hypothetical protein JTE90_021763 [Oedothorax gibbosus]|uniref:Uncharacterized protein n=1 Tax=Oedothorax gibbosus TaxID=931172 RepID=A0AAV6TYP5_9ARAC|nr:hypothetical protein JTE90_021763 [Oedothorax gibbosus]